LAIDSMERETPKDLILTVFGEHREPLRRAARLLLRAPKA
jgi:hypothetical protein